MATKNFSNCEGLSMALNLLIELRLERDKILERIDNVKMGTKAFTKIEAILKELDKAIENAKQAKEHFEAALREEAINN